MNSLLKISVIALAVFSLAASAYALSAMETVGGQIYRDTRLSINSNQSCMTCHHPSAGFADPANRRDPVGFPVSEGSIATLFGGRNAPSAAYAGFAPQFHWDNVLQTYVGGLFWDGRATGQELGDPLAEQARGPFQNPVEMGLTPDEVVSLVATSNYADRFTAVFTNTNWSDISETYNNIARAVAAFERSTSVTRFTSKFDQFWRACQTAHVDVSAVGITVAPESVPQNILSTAQLRGLVLFNTKAGCTVCHPTTDDKEGVTPPLFTNFAYANLGLPTNPRVEALSKVAPPDLGLGGVLDDAAQDGKFKVPTLRNTFKSAPYGHNGYFANLDVMVNFLNTRDLADGPWADADAEVPQNIDQVNVGNLGLTDQEEGDLVAFLKSLTDQGR